MVGLSVAHWVVGSMAAAMATRAAMMEALVNMVIDVVVMVFGLRVLSY